ncbi:MAG TPA: GPR1/FUN34/YaaH family transporter [Bryobacteraceae bacterium]|nr:GPR1/FUN34/YaaH family transporter [Bryobacteraceae bacterium]
MANGIMETSPQPRINLQPIAGPSILGLYGLAAATFMAAAYLCRWYGGSMTPLYLFPFAAMFGGLAQFLAGMWAFRARDAVATAVHGMWGSFWIAFGVLAIVMSMFRIPRPTGAWPEMGYWFIVLAAITWACVAAAAAENKGMLTTLVFLALGSTAAAIAGFFPAEWLTILTGYLFMVASFAAWYTASALMLHEVFGRDVWGIGRSRIPTPSVSLGVGEPGVVKGQA